MHAQRIRLILFSIITIIGTFLPWVSLKGDLAKIAGPNSSAGAGGVKFFYIGLMAVIIILSVLGDKGKSLGTVKKIVSAILSLLTLGLTIKYIGDASTELTSASIGLYFMLFGSFMLLVMSFLPSHILPCFAHKFIPAPKDKSISETEEN
ncbi:hypothetical protein JXR93_10200 [bacterium]|nr:hypothetical protein [bacterium]